MTLTAELSVCDADDVRGLWRQAGELRHGDEALEALVCVLWQEARCGGLVAAGRVSEIFIIIVA